MTEFGIRYKADLTGEWSDYVVDSVRLLNEQLEPEGRRFYFDQADVAQKSIGGFNVWDMYGWAVLPEEVDEFEPLWLASADRGPGEGGSTPMDGFCDVTVTWEERDGKPFARIVHYDGWDDPGTVLGDTA